MTAGPGRFDGKVVVVTGAGSGIGAAAADRFLAEGARVVYADRDAGRLSRAAASESVLPVAADIADPASVSGLVTATLDRFGRVDVVVSNVWPGGFHAFDLVAPGSALARTALEVRLAWLRRITGC